MPRGWSNVTANNTNRSGECKSRPRIQCSKWSDNGTLGECQGSAADSAPVEAHHDRDQEMSGDSRGTS